jgi:hypothetical protein
VIGADNHALMYPGGQKSMTVKSVIEEVVVSITPDQLDRNVSH